MRIEVPRGWVVCGVMLSAFFTAAVYAGDVFSDSFSRPDTLAPSGGLGSINYASVNDFYLSDGVAYHTNDNATAMGVYTGLGLTNSFSVSVDMQALNVTTTGNRYLGLVWNYQDSDNYYVFRVQVNESAEVSWQFLEYNDGAATSFSQDTILGGVGVLSLDTWYTLSVCSTDTEGTFQYSLQDSTNSVVDSGTFSDADGVLLSGGYAGFYSHNTASACDNLYLSSVRASITVDAVTSAGSINQKLFGQLVKGADNYGIFSADSPDLSVLREGCGIWDYSAQSAYSDVLEMLTSYRPGILRYPGGLTVQNHDWKDTVGPVSERGDWKFGIPEFMSICGQLNIEPVFVVSEFVGDEQDAADLVEYLNMPPTPDYPWAQLRAADGHSEPYGVVWFEIGNESWTDARVDGSGPRTAADTGLYAASVAQAMKAVDPSVRCGVPVSEKYELWSELVIQSASTNIDFVIMHTYPVTYSEGDIDDADEEALMLETEMLAGYTTARDLAEWSEQYRQIAGRDLPIAVTEYNVGPTQAGGESRPYRFTLAAAIGNGDYLGRLTEFFDDEIAMSVYWQWLNEYFGCVRTYAGDSSESLDKRSEPYICPMHYILQLWGEYRGEKKLEIAADYPVEEHSGYLTVNPCLGEKQIVDGSTNIVFAVSDQNMLDGADITAASTDTVSISYSNSVWELYFDDATGAAYPNLLNVSLSGFSEDMQPSETGLWYRISAQVRWSPDADSASASLGLEMQDGRGWSATESAVAISGLESLAEWTDISADYYPLEDTPSLTILVRQLFGTNSVSGVLQIRSLRVDALQSTSMAACAISDQNILDDADITANSTDTVSVSYSNSIWSLYFDEAGGTAYPNLMNVSLAGFPENMQPSEPNLFYRISAEARWSPDAGSASASLGLGMQDGRGWSETESAIAVSGLESLTDWTEFSSDYEPLDDTPSLTVLVRQLFGTNTVSGLLEIRNLTVEAWRGSLYPARPALSAYASLSDDGSEMYLTVFNMSLDNDITSSISLEGFSASAASYSEVNAESAVTIGATDRVAEDEALELDDPMRFTHVFPAHSATGILLERMAVNDDFNCNDDFNRDDTAYTTNGLSLGDFWINDGSGQWKIEDNQLHLYSPESASSVLYNTALKIPDRQDGAFTLEASVKGFKNPSWIGLVFNYQDSSNYYAFRYKVGYSNWQFLKIENGVLYLLDSGNADLVFSAECWYDVLATSQEGYEFSVQVTDHDTGVVQLAQTNVVDSSGAFSGGYAGVISFSYGSSDPLMSVDDFSLEVSQGDGGGFIFVLK